MVQLFSKEIECSARGFEDIFSWERFYFAVINKKNSATAPVPFGNEPCICLNKSRLKKELVFFKVLPAFHFLKAALENHKYPFPVSGQTASIMWLFYPVKEEKVLPKGFWITLQV